MPRTGIKVYSFLTVVTVCPNVSILTASQTDPINVITYSIDHTIPSAELSAPSTIVSRSAYCLNIQIEFLLDIFLIRVSI